MQWCCSEMADGSRIRATVDVMRMQWVYTVYMPGYTCWPDFTTWRHIAYKDGTQLTLGRSLFQIFAASYRSDSFQYFIHIAVTAFNTLWYWVFTMIRRLCLVGYMNVPVFSFEICPPHKPGPDHLWPYKFPQCLILTHDSDLQCPFRWLPSPFSVFSVLQCGALRLHPPIFSGAQGTLPSLPNVSDGVDPLLRAGSMRPVFDCDCLYITCNSPSLVVTLPWLRLLGLSGLEVTQCPMVYLFSSFRISANPSSWFEIHPNLDPFGKRSRSFRHIISGLAPSIGRRNAGELIAAFVDPST